MFVFQDNNSLVWFWNSSYVFWSVKPKIQRSFTKSYQAIATNVRDRLKKVKVVFFIYVADNFLFFS